MLALDGRCKTLDAAADGYVRAEAAIVIRIDLLDGPGVSSGGCDDPSDDSRPAAACLMAGSFVNQDGRSSSLTAPNGPSQQQVRWLRSPQARTDTMPQLKGCSAGRHIGYPASTRFRHAATHLHPVCRSSWVPWRKQASWQQTWQRWRCTALAPR